MLTGSIPRIFTGKDLAFTLKSILRLAADIRLANGPPEYFELDDV